MSNRPVSLLQRLLIVALSVSAAGLLLTIHLPHQHADGSSSNDQGHSCSITKIHQGFSPSVPGSLAQILQAAAPGTSPLCLRRLLGPALVRDPFTPRAPPQLS